ncbi:MAG TPA: YdiU family protein [Steroidobacteraceae bacterium]|nr:YdiU family protein [Steroidobacteraceae bacterium]
MQPTRAPPIEPGATPRPRFPFDNSLARLADRFHARLAPTPVAAPQLIALNRPLAEELGLEIEGLGDAQLAGVFSGNVLPEGAEPVALAYAGHQFGRFVPQLGDGRALLLGEVRDRRGGRRELQLKGSGPTPWSRDGDGRAALGPVLREYLVSEAMHALGIPTTRALAAVLTGECVYRERPLPGAVLTRVASSHLRVGTYQYFAARGDLDAVRQLADLAIERHYPEIGAAPDRPAQLLAAVTARQASLIARWMCVGFVHGVMNTDNTAISGETLDFGPCAFLDVYDPNTVFSSIDSLGRYSYANQPAAAQWNLARFAESLLELIDPALDQAVARATQIVAGFSARYESAWLEGMRAKLGLATAEGEDEGLIRDWLELLRSASCDFTTSFRALSERVPGEVPAGPAGTSAAPAVPGPWSAPGYPAWEARWRARLEREARPMGDCAALMRASNPACIPRNHRIEQLIEAAVEQGDFRPFHSMLDALSQPYLDRPGLEAYREPPAPQERVLRTFCGT